jgi:hypothetical protein
MDKIDLIFKKTETRELNCKGFNRLAGKIFESSMRI